jgi:DNA-binding TFAR19-related protein (PDSD5 family)
VRRVQLVKPEKAQQVENAILARAQRGQIAEKVSEEVVIQMLQAGGGGGEKARGSVTYKRRNLDDDDEW